MAHTMVMPPPPPPPNHNFAIFAPVIMKFDTSMKVEVMCGNKNVCDVNIIT